MSYKNIVDRFFVLVTKHMSNRQTDEHNYDSQDRASIARAIKNNDKNNIYHFTSCIIRSVSVVSNKHRYAVNNYNTNVKF